MNTKATILASTTTFGKSIGKSLEKISDKFNLVINPKRKKLTEAELLTLLEEFKPIGLLAGTEIISKKTLNASRNYLKVISRVGVGCDNIDMCHAKQVGIKVFRTRGVLNQSVAELTIGLILSALRNITLSNNFMLQGIWKKKEGNLLKGKNVGIIGYGDIGQTLEALLKAFGCKIKIFDMDPKKKLLNKYSAIDHLLLTSDIITLHASGDHEIIGLNELRLLSKRKVIIVNTARGGLINEDALFKYLEKNPQSFACLDVYNTEPYIGDLHKLDNVLATPHIGSYATEARTAMELLALENLIHNI